MIFPRQVTCALCGASSRHQVMVSASAFGACDLDTRLPGALGKAIEYQVQRCPACGYCAQDLSAPAGNLWMLSLVQPVQQLPALVFLKAGDVVRGEVRESSGGGPCFPGFASLVDTSHDVGVGGETVALR